MASTCPSCNAEVPTGATTCPACHAAVAAKPASHVIGALSYLGFFVTGIVFLVIEPYSHDEFIRFHARQSIAFTVAWFAFYIITLVFIGVLPGPLSNLLAFLARVGHIAFAVVWVYLMYQAYIGNKFRVPVLADWVEGAGF